MLKTKTKVRIGFVSVLSIAAGVQASAIVSQQVAADDTTTFTVNVVESLSVSLTTPKDQASGGINTFLRNTVTLGVTSNNAKGFTASMYSSGDSTELTNSSASSSISTLGDAYDSTGVARSSFPADAWGYSLGSGTLNTASNSKTYGETGSVTGPIIEGQETTDGNPNSKYYPMKTSSNPINILYSDEAASITQDIYFGAKASASKASGTYTGNVLISVVTGDITEENPVVPDSPATDNTGEVQDPETEKTEIAVNSPNPVYSSTSNRTVYSSISTNSEDNTTTTTTEVSSGDTTNSYVAPAGVIEETASTINTGAPLATGLAVTAAVAAASGIFFFILAKRKKDDEDEEEDEA